MKNKKIWCFVGIVLLVFTLYKVFDWSEQLENLEVASFLKQKVNCRKYEQSSKRILAIKKICTQKVKHF